jgi:hypothetical protein
VWAADRRAYSDILRRVDDTERRGVVDQVCRVVLRVAGQAHLEPNRSLMRDCGPRWLMAALASLAESRFRAMVWATLTGGA